LPHHKQCISNVLYCFFWYIRPPYFSSMVNGLRKLPGAKAPDCPPKSGYFGLTIHVWPVDLSRTWYGFRYDPAAHGSGRWCRSLPKAVGYLGAISMRVCAHDGTAKRTITLKTPAIMIFLMSMPSYGLRVKSVATALLDACRGIIPSLILIFRHLTALTLLVRLLAPSALEMPLAHIPR